MMTDEERRARLRRVMEMHKRGYPTRLIKQRCNLQVSDAVKLANELGIPWAGKPIKERVKKA